MTTPTKPTACPVTGFASISATAILANARHIPATKTVVFDVQLYLGAQEPLMGSMRYYNTNNALFDADIRLYEIYATFSINAEGADVFPSEGRQACNYVCIGDIQHLTDLGPPGPHYLRDPSDADNTPPTFSINMCEQPFMHLMGVASFCDKSTGSFCLHITQYITHFKDSNTTTKPTVTYRCRFPQGGKYKEGNYPMPVEQHWVMINGFLSDVIYNNSNSKEGIESLTVDINSIAFGGRYFPAATRAPTASTANANAGPLWDYSKGSQPIKQDESAMVSPPASKKRKGAN